MQQHCPTDCKNRQNGKTMHPEILLYIQTTINSLSENISKSYLQQNIEKKLNGLWHLKNIYYKLFFFFNGIKKEKTKSHLICLCDHGSLPLTHLCCSTRLLRSASMCLALSQLSLDRDVCPRLRDNNLQTESQSVSHIPLE